MCSIGLKGQTKQNLRKIDSIRQCLSNDKAIDTISIGKRHYQIGELFRRSLLSDSAYFHYQKAEKIFKTHGHKYDTALTLFGIAVCQTYDKDYTGSEVTSIEALTLLSKLKQNNDVRKYKSYVYNNLGIVFNELGQFEESINYYEKALDFKKNLVGNFERSIGNTLNNIAYTYKSSGQYKLAIEKYEQILKNKNLSKERPDSYALALNNYAHTLYLSKRYNKLPQLYFKALKVTDSVNPNGYNSIIINQHLAEYYNGINNKDSAKYYGYKAKQISTQYHNDDLLKSLLLLSEIEEGEKAAIHLKQYVKLNDSLQKAERTVRNKFARIRFETQEIKQENIQITKERTWLLIMSLVIIIASFLLYLFISQRVKNKELEFKQSQQEANEEIYNLMLSQNENIEEARTQEKKRISEELHDGVLGRLFGTRLSLDSLNMATSEDAINTRGQYIIGLKDIEDDIREVSHKLNTDFVSGSGFIDIIKTLVDTQTLAYNLKYKLEHDDNISWDLVSNKKKINIYRIIQESMHNIYKHANANQLFISLELKKDVILVVLRDDGSGFETNKAKSGIGLKNMNSRIKEIKGEIKITSKKGFGTTVAIQIPITNDEKL